MLWSFDTCQVKVSADQYHVTISQAQVQSSLRYWFSIGSQAQARLTHLNTNEALFFTCFLWLDAATRPCDVNYSS